MMLGLCWKRWFMFMLLAVLITVGFSTAAEEIVESDVIEKTMTVTASLLNGRSSPSKRASVEALFDCEDEVSVVGWSKNHHWIEVRGGETGTVWVWWEYLTERTDVFRVWNNYGSKVKIRKEPYGTVVGYLKNGSEAVIDQVVFGWGHCNRGWVQLEYLTEED